MSGISGSGCELIRPTNPRKELIEIEKNLITIYRKPIWSRFTKALKEYKLVNSGDKIAVGISGGKDSLLLAKLFQQLRKHSDDTFELEFISMDPGFHSSNRERLEEHCDFLNIPVKIFDKNLFKVVDEIANDYPCYLCARMRRGALYAAAQELGCNKLALGHHFDDVIETIMMNVLCSGKYQTMMPKLKSKNFENMELIRPLYEIREDDIKTFAMDSGLSPMNCGCVVAAKKTSSKRREVKELIKTLGSSFKDVEKSIFMSSKNIYQDAIIGWRNGDSRYSFLDEYDT
jgi:tRNA(Ile)-lysidine synthase TilS/MesJ